MSGPFLNKHLSLAVKNAFIYLILILFSSFLIGYSIYRLSAALILSSSKDQIKNEVQNMALKMTTYFDNIGRDIRFLSRNPLVKDYIHSTVPTDALNLKLTEEFKVLLESRASYFQIRLIGVANNGKELVRVDRAGAYGWPTSEDSLQQKGDRNYFTETIKLKAGSIYFSEIDLNREFGKIDFPYRPTLRAASPLYIGDQLFGIVIINTDLNQLFEEIKKTITPTEELFVFNNDGYFLIHPDESECFGFEFGRPPNVYHWFPQIKNLDRDLDQINLPESPARKVKTVTDFYILPHPISDYKLFIALSTAESNILYPFISWRKNTLVLTLGITFIFLGIAFLWMRRQSKELKSITKSMVRFSKDYSDSKLPIHNTDEIGDLANAFSTMASVIRTNVKDLESSRETAIKANQSKEEFLENMSHEIRNPLQSILGMTNILEQNNPRPDQNTVIKTIQFSSKQLLSLVNDILDFSKIRIGEIQLQEEECDLGQLISDIIRSHQFLAQSKNISLESAIPSELNDFKFLVDALRLSQILNNLIVNAIKFTFSGGTILLSLQSKIEESKATLHIAVSDNGMGIGHDEVDKIKNRYYSGPSEINSNLSGAGLGLPIVIQLLKLFQSELNVTSEINQGSRFSFTLHLTCLKKGIEQTIISTSKQTLPPGIKDVLCIDDDPQILYFFKQAFAELGQNLICVQDEIELSGIETVATFDLIIADLILGANHIVGLLSQLNRLKKPNGILLVFSGMDPAQKIEEPDQEMIDAYIQKPISISLLFIKIQNVWNTKNHTPPVMHAFYEDYDFNRQLIENGLRLLIQEWAGMKLQLLHAIRDMDQEGFDLVFHKIITTIRRFQLFYLLDILEEIQQKIVQSNGVNTDEIKLLETIMMEIQQYFETQLKGLSSIL